MKPFICARCGAPLDQLREIVEHRIFSCPRDSDGTATGNDVVSGSSDRRFQGERTRAAK